MTIILIFSTKTMTEMVGPVFEGCRLLVSGFVFDFDPIPRSSILCVLALLLLTWWLVAEVSSAFHTLKMV